MANMSAREKATIPGKDVSRENDTLQRTHFLFLTVSWLNAPVASHLFGFSSETLGGNLKRGETSICAELESITA
jgi:hypothetical protein